ncbi:MAG: hypothetical protein FWC47_00605 [Oscillospiraceae bacterium]|nr:hypothetical protein [Oscillospiraceae bacterium]
MFSAISNEFITIRDWHRAVVGGKELILRNTSALEHLQLFVGYVHETQIDVYAKEKGNFDNVNYYIVNNFKNIEYIRIQNVLCTSINQTFNDMLSQDDVDEQSLLEALNSYYFTHGKTFSGLNLIPRNLARFNDIKQMAIEYYKED